MPVQNADIAAVFDEIADLLEIDNANPFRVRAYRNAAQALRDLGRDIRDMAASGADLTELPCIGKDLAAKIHEIIETGSARVLTQLHRRLPHSLTELLKIPGLGPRRVRILQQELDINTVEQLHRAARDGRVRELPGFGEKTETHILEALEAHAGSPARMKLSTAAQYARGLVAHLKKSHGVNDVVVTGSFRRAKETIGDLDLVVTAADANTVIADFIRYEDVQTIVAHGPTRATVTLRNGPQVDLRLVANTSFGAALHYFTGSKAHNIAVRKLAQARGLKINEYGVFDGKRQIAGETETSVFDAVGLPYIEPELRENRGEIEAARAGRLPHLVELGDLKGNLHTHTKATDGHDSLREMALAARDHGFEYLAITEHSRRLAMVHGLDPTRLLAQMDQIDALNAQLTGITLLKGIEVDILEDGRLDLPDNVLKRLDLVIGAVHSYFHLSRAKQTERILKAMDDRYFTLLAHPFGRMIGEREPYDVDMLKIIRHARQRGCYLELNAHPQRLDLLDTYCHAAKDEGVLICINADAHSVLDIDNLQYGIGQARRGWLEKKDVLNTRTLKQLRPLLARS